ncbi:MAG: DUF3135 domain-containing protein [Gammaproteobacteria bacterium]|nr:DUF3135 domain-containing protein [Gammaproteobacteria bacterium]
MRKMQLQKNSGNKFDFDHWSEIAKTDPDAFESMRNERLSACIDQAPDNVQQRLRCLQWRIDRVREQSKTPLAACIKISGMMWETVHQLGDSYQMMSGDKRGASRETYQKASARVLPFRPRTDQDK